VRLLLHDAKVDYEDVRMSYDEWLKMKAEHPEKFEFGQLPVLERDGKCYPQSLSIMRMLAKEHGFYPKEKEELWRVESIIDWRDDYLNRYIPIMMEKDEEAKKKGAEEFVAGFLQTWLKKVEELLKANSS